MKMRAIMAILAAAAVTVSAQEKQEPKGTVTMSGAWALYPMAVKWAEEYQKLYPGVKIDVSAGGAGKGMTDTLAGAVDIGLLSRDVNNAEAEKGAFAFAVTKDAVVPTVNAKNPFLAEIMKKGAKKETFRGIWITTNVTTWGDVLGDPANKTEIRVYTRADACGAAETWSKYMGGSKQDDLKKGIGVHGDPGIGEAVRKDKLGIGYNNVNFAYDSRTGKPVKGLAILPIDIDGNGSVDAAENVYSTQKELIEAIVKGVYPSPPARDLYFVTKGQPGNQAVKAFIQWVLTDGQKFVEESGYIKLPVERLAEEAKKL